jgi:hypothetical protein
MGTSSSFAITSYELGQALRRRWWHPLRRMMEIFHILPLTAAIFVFFLLASQAQLREIYLSYLEGLKDPTLEQTASNVWIFLAAAAGLALISAALYEAHYWLSTMRINVVYSSLSDPESGSVLRGLQRIAAIGLALVPWLGVVAGLFYAKLYLINRYKQLGDAGINPDTMNYLQTPGTLAILISMVVLALVVAFFLDRYRASTILQSVTVAAIPFAAIGLFLLLTDLPLGALTGSRLVGGLVIALISAAYYLGYYRLYTMRSGWIYTQPTFPDTGINRRRRRRIALFTWAVLPWLGIGLYFVIKAMATPATAYSLPFVAIFRDLPSVSRWAVIPVMMSWVIAAGLGVAMLLDHFRESSALPRAIIGILVALMIGASIISYRNVDTSVDTIVWLYRLLGPLASAMLMLLLAVAAFTLLAVLSQKSGFPVLSLVVLAVVVNAIFPVPIKVTAIGLAIACTVFVLMALFSRLWAVAIMAIVMMLPGILGWLQQSRSISVEPSAGSASDLKNQFKDWLDARVDATAYSGRSYPVFIIAVEGGGIYAASAASLFLAKLEDDNPGFSHHVFAISGVSGGAIGATVFQALVRSKFASTSASTSVGSDECLQRNPSPDAPVSTHSLVPTVSCIMQDDHLSPVVGAIVPEFLAASAIGRPDAVAGSFRYSVYQRDRAAGEALGQRFANYWSPGSEAPALVLNATWAETGFRVAFSPFALHAYDDSLYSFSDKNMPGDRDIKVIDAAVVSARFPGMLPPFSVMMKEKKEELPWNFVDGGYSDNSGASTALAIYRALESVPGNAEIKIILLTSSNPQPDLTPEAAAPISGTLFRDTLAPITALLKVRQGLGNQAVARVCEQLKTREDRDGNCKSQARKAMSPLKIVELEVQTYELPLGWKLSRTTFEVVKWMLGKPELCKSGNAQINTEKNNNRADDDSKRILESNSCVLQWVADLLGSKQTVQ